VGTPVLTHDVGAAREVLHPANPVVPPRFAHRAGARLAKALNTRGLAGFSKAAMRLGMFDEYIETLRHWRSGGRPQVVARAAFRLSAVAHEWRQLLFWPPH